MKVYTVKPADVGKSAYSNGIDPQLRRFLFSFHGSVLPADIGKEIHVVNSLYYIENNEQRDKRNANSTQNS